MLIYQNPKAVRCCSDPFIINERERDTWRKRVRERDGLGVLLADYTVCCTLEPIVHLPSEQTYQIGLSFNWTALTEYVSMGLGNVFSASMVWGELALYVHHKQDFGYCSYVCTCWKGVFVVCITPHIPPPSCVAACSLLVHGMYRCLDVMATISVVPLLFSVNRTFRIYYVDVTHFKPWGKNRVLLTNCPDVFALFACVMLFHNSHWIIQTSRIIKVKTGDRLFQIRISLVSP